MMYICKHRNKEGKPCPEVKNGTCSYGMKHFCGSTTKKENATKIVGIPVINLYEYITLAWFHFKKFFNFKERFELWKLRKEKF